MANPSGSTRKTIKGLIRMLFWLVAALHSIFSFSVEKLLCIKILSQLLQHCKTAEITGILQQPGYHNQLTHLNDDYTDYKEHLQITICYQNLLVFTGLKSMEYSRMHYEGVLRLRLIEFITFTFWFNVDMSLAFFGCQSSFYWPFHNPEPVPNEAWLTSRVRLYVPPMILFNVPFMTKWHNNHGGICVMLYHKHKAVLVHKSMTLFYAWASNSIYYKYNQHHPQRHHGWEKIELTIPIYETGTIGKHTNKASGISTFTNWALACTCVKNSYCLCACFSDGWEKCAEVFLVWSTGMCKARVSLNIFWQAWCV